MGNRMPVRECGKLKYTLSGAVDKLKFYKTRRRQNKATAYYFCGVCMAYHLTSKRQRKKR